MQSKKVVGMMLAIFAASGGLVYFKTVRTRQAEEKIAAYELRLDAIRAAMCACHDKDCRAAERKNLELAGTDLGDLQVPGDQEERVRASIKAKFDLAEACLRAPLAPAPGGAKESKR